MAIATTMATAFCTLTPPFSNRGSALHIPVWPCHQLQFLTEYFLYIWWKRRAWAHAQGRNNWLPLSPPSRVTRWWQLHEAYSCMQLQGCMQPWAQGRQEGKVIPSDYTHTATCFKIVSFCLLLLLLRSSPPSPSHNFFLLAFTKPYSISPTHLLCSSLTTQTS